MSKTRQCKCGQADNLDKKSMCPACLSDLNASVTQAILTAAGLSAAVGAAPIPFADWMVLSGIQTGMLGVIAAAYGLNLTKGFLSTLVGSAIGAGGATVIGKYIVTNIAKMIPFLAAATAPVSAATAAALTTAVGFAFDRSVNAVLSRGEAPSPENIAKEFKLQLRRTDKADGL